MIALVGAVFAASLLGSTHCASMCGGLVCFYAGANDGDRSRPRWLVHAGYHGGRLIAYSALGALAGALGAGVESIGAWAGIERAATIVAGSLMVLWGAGALLAASGHALPRLGGAFGSRVRLVSFGWTRSALGRAHALSPTARALVVGLVSAFLPCGWLYAFVTTAAGTAHPLSGALAMAAFWAGTVPLLAGVGVAAHVLSANLRRRLPVYGAIVVMAAGLLAVAGKWTPHRMTDHGTAHAGHAGEVEAGGDACH